MTSSTSGGLVAVVTALSGMSRFELSAGASAQERDCENGPRPGAEGCAEEHDVELIDDRAGHQLVVCIALERGGRAERRSRGQPRAGGEERMKADRGEHRHTDEHADDP